MRNFDFQEITMLKMSGKFKVKILNLTMPMDDVLLQVLGTLKVQSFFARDIILEEINKNRFNLKWRALSNDRSIEIDKVILDEIIYSTFFGPAMKIGFPTLEFSWEFDGDDIVAHLKFEEKIESL